jgi:hypothetical protein
LKALAEGASIGILADEAPEQTRVARFAARNKSVLIGSAVLAIIVLIGVLAPFLGTIGSGTDQSRRPQPDAGERNHLPQRGRHAEPSHALDGDRQPRA